MEGTQCRNSYWAGTWRQESMQKPWKGDVTDLLLMAISAFYRTKDYQPRRDTTYNRLGSSTSITN